MNKISGSQTYQIPQVDLNTKNSISKQIKEFKVLLQKFVHFIWDKAQDSIHFQNSPDGFNHHQGKNHSWIRDI